MDLGYKLHGIEIIESMVAQKPIGFLGTSYGFNINAETRVRPSDNVVIVFVDVQICEDHKRDVILGKLKTGIGFTIHNFSDIIIKKDDRYVIPQEIEINLRMIAISTTRGILFSHVKGTYLANSLLPLIPALISPIHNTGEKRSTKLKSTPKKVK